MRSCDCSGKPGFGKMFLAASLFFLLSIFLLPSAARAATIPTLKANKVKSFTGRSGTYHTFKFKADKTGYIAIYTTQVVTVQLRDNSNKILSVVANGNSEMSFEGVLPSQYSPEEDSENVNAVGDPFAKKSPAYFAVKKGKTYRLRVLKFGNGTSRIMYKIKKLSAVNNTKKSSAVRIKNTGKVDQQINGKKTYWLSYKLDADKNYTYFEIGKQAFMAQGETRKVENGGRFISIDKSIKPEVAVTIYSPAGEKVGFTEYLGGNISVGRMGSISGQDYLAPGTYLIKVESKSKNNSGFIRFYFDRKS